MPSGISHRTLASLVYLIMFRVQISDASPHVDDVRPNIDCGINANLHLPVWLERPVPARVRYLRRISGGVPGWFLGYSNVLAGDGPMPPAGSI